MKKYIDPVRIVESKLAENPQNLLIKKALQISLSEPKITTFAAGGYVILVKYNLGTETRTMAIKVTV